MKKSTRRPCGKVTHHKPPRKIVVVHTARHVQPPPKPASLPDPVKLTNSLPTISQVKFNVGDAAVAALVGALLVLLLAFPAEIFNKTYDENEDEIHGLLNHMGLHKHHLSSGLGLLAYVLGGTALFAWIALSSEGQSGNPVALATGLLVAIPLVTFAFEGPREIYARARSKIAGELKVLPTALFVGLACALFSRALHLEPAYIYGVFAGFAAERAGKLTEEHEGKGVLIAAATLAVVGIACWAGWSALNGEAHGVHRDWPVIIGSTALFMGFVLAAEALVFGLIPMEFLDGAILKNWQGRIWFVAQVAAAAFFVYVQMFHGETKKINDLHELIKPAIFFLTFGAISFAFWGYFRWEGRPTAPHRGEAGTEALPEIEPAPEIIT